MKAVIPAAGLGTRLLPATKSMPKEMLPVVDKPAVQYVIEEAVRADIASAHFDRGIRLARTALEVDPSAEQLELSLLRLYRLSGAHAAAAEQYAHYANVMKTELGLQPPALHEL
jgi:CTP:molybdopterin cytidylyltransferase MocA